MKRTLLFAALLLTAATVSAEVRPRGGPSDMRVKDVSYNRDDVVKVVGHFGFSTDIEFDPSEQVKSVAMGDSLAWEVAPVGSHVFVKPRENNARTNMTIITNKRVYQFALNAAPASKAHDDLLYFAVRFKYPEEIARLSREADDRRRAESALALSTKRTNYNYYACGTRVIRPTDVSDDGRFTYFRFPNAQEIPAIFLINSDGTESLSNGQMRGEEFVVYATARKFRLRKGKSTACIENRGFNPYGIATPNGTTSPAVVRSVQGTTAPLPTRATPTNPPPDVEDAAFTLPSMPLQLQGSGSAQLLPLPAPLPQSPARKDETP